MTVRPAPCVADISCFCVCAAAVLPAFPVRAACALISDPSLSGWDLMAAANTAAGVFNNATGTLACNPPPSDVWQDGVYWDYQWCTEMLPEETFWGMDGQTDMFWFHAWNLTEVTAHCQRKVWGSVTYCWILGVSRCCHALVWLQYGVSPRPYWISTEYGTLEDIARYASNIGLLPLDPFVFSGLLFPVVPLCPVSVHQRQVRPVVISGGHGILVKLPPRDFHG